MHTTLAAVSTAVVAAACAALLASAPAVAGTGTVEGPMTAFADPYGDGRANPAAGVSARVHAVATGTDRSVVTLHVDGLVPDRGYGAHVHVGACADNKGRGHYMHDPAAGATADNEVWLDMVANAAGRGHAQALVEWTFRAGEARSVVLHDRVTDAAGTAGPKLACLDVAF